MKLEQTHIDQIRSAFGKMQTKGDLLHLLNEVKPLVYGDKAVPFELKQLTWYANPKLGQKRYAAFKIKKKSGAERCIHAPVKGLKALQKTLSVILQCVFEPHEAAMGFVKDRSIVDNAKLHAGSRYVYNIDLKDFFPSVDQARVWKCLQLRPFNLNKTATVKPQYEKWEDFKKEYLKTEEPVKFFKGIGRLFTHTPYGNIYVAQNFDAKKDKYVLLGDNKLTTKEGKSLEGTLWLVNKIPDSSRLEIANIIAALCCTEMEVERKNESGEWEKVKRNVLPQGAPTSPVITNIVCQRMDQLLSGVGRRFGLKYSRYADDITFSSMHNVYQPNGVFLKELHRIITEQGFHIKESKTRLQKEGYRKEVTGLLVNEKANVQKRYIKQLRKWLYYWERYGEARASGFFKQEYIAEKGNVKKSTPPMANVIAGKLEYLKMVKGSDNDLYLKLKNRFHLLIGKSEPKEEINLDPKTLSYVQNVLAELPLKTSEANIEIPNAKDTKIISPASITLPIFHNPKKLVDLLKNFSVNNSPLKYTTHSWDAGRDANMFKDITEFLSLAEDQYKEFSYDLKELSNNLNAKIYYFLFSPDVAKTGWGDRNRKKRIYFGWSSPELTEACKLDASLNPEDFILPEKYQVQRAGKTIQKFKHVIDLFKNEIEIRDENAGLENLILLRHNKYLFSFSDPIISNLENKTFYTDIQWLSSALDLIFEGIQKYSQHPEIEYYVSESENDRMVLNILHRNSFKSGLSIYDDKLNLKRGDFSTIKDNLTNLCDWSIESKFSEGNYRINYLVSDQETPPYQKIATAQGFKHILTFYK